MLGRILVFAIAFLVPACAAAQEDTGPAPDVEAIHHLIERYTKAVDTVDLNLLSQIWSHSPEVSFIYPLGEEHGFDAIEQHVFKNVMGGMFSARDLETHGVAVRVNGNAAWSEFHWVFRATMRKDGSAVTTHGVETQIYRKEAGKWRLVHVHYSEDREVAQTLPGPPSQGLDERIGLWAAAGNYCPYMVVQAMVFSRNASYL
jgi:ketosteroid isomerase-like protein